MPTPFTDCSGPTQLLFLAGPLHFLGYEYALPWTWIAAASAATGILLLAGTWWRRHARQRAPGACRCPRCKYDLRGTFERSGFPLRCSECALDIASEQGLIKPFPVRWLIGLAVLLFVAAHVTALWPQVRRHGWARLVPTTVLVVRPMNVTAWTDRQLRADPVGIGELARRFNEGELWAWQERLLFKRIEVSCNAQDAGAAEWPEASTRVRIHHVAPLAHDEVELYDMIDLFGGLIGPAWLDEGGNVTGGFAISGHFVVGGTTRFHAEIEELLSVLRDPRVIEPPWPRPYRPPENPRAIQIFGEYPTGFLANLRAARAVSIEALRCAGPNLDDRVTEEELNACGRAGFGLLDELRSPLSQRWAADAVGDDQHGWPGIRELLALIAAWGTSTGGELDFDFDGVIGQGDLEAILTASSSGA